MDISSREAKKVILQFEAHKEKFYEGSSSMRIDLPGPGRTFSIADKVDQGEIMVKKSTRPPPL